MRYHGLYYISGYVVRTIYLITLGFFCAPVTSYLFFTTLLNSARRAVYPCHRSTTICFSAGSDVGNWATVKLWFGETDQETRANGVKGVLAASWKNKHFRVFIIMKKKILLYTTSIFTHWKTDMKKLELYFGKSYSLARSKWKCCVLAKVEGSAFPQWKTFYLNRIQAFPNGNRKKYLCFGPPTFYIFFTLKIGL